MKSLTLKIENENFDTSVAVSAGMARVMQKIRIWKQRADTRIVLRQLSSEALDDIGVSRADALVESQKSFWRN
jgi:uncharacterized protein YjiS (DUF1127 family)